MGHSTLSLRVQETAQKHPLSSICIQHQDQRVSLVSVELYRLKIWVQAPVLAIIRPAEVSFSNTLHPKLVLPCRAGKQEEDLPTGTNNTVTSLLL